MGRWGEKNDHRVSASSCPLWLQYGEELLSPMANIPISPFPRHQSVSGKFRPEDRILKEIHLYHGSLCNRTCRFCNVYGGPAGWFEEIRAPVLDALLRVVSPDGNVKIYGGEPTLHTENILWAFGYLRARGFRGPFTVFSNGIRADDLVRLLGSDESVEAVLNYSILTGEGADPVPEASLETLIRYAEKYPGRLFSGHSDIGPVGRAASPRTRAAWPDRPEFEGECPRCYPVLTTRGRYRACPFAVETDAVRYRLGDLRTDAEELRSGYARFLTWVDRTVMPAARDRGVHPCTLCVRLADR